MSTTDAPEPAHTDERLCIHCGYNLYGLPDEGRCPECFTPIQESLRGDLLRYSDPAWLDQLAFGALLKLWNILLGFVLAIGGGVLMALSAPPVFAAGLTLLGGAAGLWAAFLITTQEPRNSLREDPVTWRRVVRFCATVGYIGSVVAQMGEFDRSPAWLKPAGSGLSLAGMVAFWGELVYLRRFAERVPDPKLARSTRVVTWGCVIYVGLVIIVGFVTALIGLNPGGPVPPGLGPGPVRTAPGLTLLVGVVCVATIPGLVFMIWYIVLLFRYRGVFKTAAVQARSNQ